MPITFSFMTEKEVVEKYYSGDFTSRDFVFSDTKKIILEVSYPNWRNEINQLDYFISKILKRISGMKYDKFFPYSNNNREDSFFFVIVPKQVEQYNKLKKYIEEKIISS